MTQKKLKILTFVFWSALAVTVVGLTGSIAQKIFEIKGASRTQLTGSPPIPVPAEPLSK